MLKFDFLLKKIIFINKVVQRNYFYFDKKQLKYIPVKSLNLVILLIIAGIMGFFIGGAFNKPIYKMTHPSFYENPPNIIKVGGLASDFSEEKLIKFIKELNIKFPYIVLAQAKHETNNFTSKIFKENNNLFGMKEAYARVNTAKGTQYKHAYYNTWRESVYDYAFYQASYLNNLKTENEYLQYLGQSYAEDTTYVSQILRRIRSENLKEVFD